MAVAQEVDPVAVAVGQRHQIPDLSFVRGEVRDREVHDQAGGRCRDPYLVGFAIPLQRPARAGHRHDGLPGIGDRIVQDLRVVTGEVDAGGVDRQADVQGGRPARAEQPAGLVAGGVGTPQEERQHAGQDQVGVAGQHAAGDDVDGVAALAGQLVAAAAELLHQLAAVLVHQLATELLDGFAADEGEAEHAGAHEGVAPVALHGIAGDLHAGTGEGDEVVGFGQSLR